MVYVIYGKDLQKLGEFTDSIRSRIFLLLFSALFRILLFFGLAALITADCITIVEKSFYDSVV